jgi:peroxiredoxin
MVELGQLERRHGDFQKRQVRVLAISNDSQEVARATQADFPHLGIVSDADQQMAKALEVIHHGAGPGRTDTNAPTTFLVDGTGTVRWLFRPDHFTQRLSPDDLLAAIDRAWPRK